MKPCLTLLYVHGDSLGYGRYGTRLAESLEDIGVDVYDHQAAPNLPQSAGDKAVAEGRRAKDTNVVAWVSVPSHANAWMDGQTAVISTMWEATVLPESFRDTLHNFDTVIVPSRHNVELFGKYHHNVKYVPLGIDPRVWHFQQRKEPGMFFNFLIGGSGKRKGTDLAHKAFMDVFGGYRGDGPIPRLVMKNPKNEGFTGEQVEVVSGRISSRAEVDLYSDAHVYLQPSRGEGFGLQPLQAIAQGCPTILTGAHGHESFADLGMPISSSLVPAEYFIYGDAGEWWEPDYDELCQLMEFAYNNYPAVQKRAEFNAKVAAREFTWKQTARKFVDAIGEDKLTTPYEGPRVWIIPEIKRYLVRVVKPWSAEVAGVQYQFQPGQDYYEFADVKRIMFEAGLLDPSCLGQYLEEEGHLDSGLTPEQVERIPNYTASHAFCHACGQKLGSEPTHADLIFDELTKASDGGGSGKAVSPVPLRRVENTSKESGYL